MKFFIILNILLYFSFLFLIAVLQVFIFFQFYLVFCHSNSLNKKYLFINKSFSSLRLLYFLFIIRNSLLKYLNFSAVSVFSYIFFTFKLSLSSSSSSVTPFSLFFFVWSYNYFSSNSTASIPFYLICFLSNSM
jgi:hypothetical protein